MKPSCGLSTPAQNCESPIGEMGTRKAKFLREPGDAARARRRAGRRCWRPGAASEACASPHVSMPACMRRRVRIPRREPALPPPGACARARGRRASADELLCGCAGCRDNFEKLSLGRRRK